MPHNQGIKVVGIIFLLVFISGGNCNELYVYGVLQKYQKRHISKEPMFVLLYLLFNYLSDYELQRQLYMSYQVKNIICKL